MTVALVLVFIGLATMVALPYRVGKRGVGAEPLPHLAMARSHRYRSVSSVTRVGNGCLQVALPLCGGAVILGGILWLTGSRAGGLSLSLVGAVTGASFIWQTGSGRACITGWMPGGSTASSSRGKSPSLEPGLRSFPAHQFMPGLAQMWVYYCILSPGCVIAFPHTLEAPPSSGNIIEQATGMHWPEQETKAS